MNQHTVPRFLLKNFTKDKKRRISPRRKLDPAVLAEFQRLGRIGGKKGGPKGGVARWDNVSAKERTAHARRAVGAREAKRTNGKKG
jgi:hypothetical protein